MCSNKCDAHGTCNTNSQTKFKVSMSQSSLGDYSDGYILVSRTLTVAELEAGGGNSIKKVTFKNCTPFTDCISKINNTQVDNVEAIDMVMPMYI